MPIITIDECDRIAAEHHAAEEQRNAPAAVARRAVFALRSALADLDDADCAAILDLLRVELYELPATA